MKLQLRTEEAAIVIDEQYGKELSARAQCKLNRAAVREEEKLAEKAKWENERFPEEARRERERGWQMRRLKGLKLRKGKGH